MEGLINSIFFYTVSQNRVKDLIKIVRGVCDHHMITFMNVCEEVLFLSTAQVANPLHEADEEEEEVMLEESLEAKPQKELKGAAEQAKMGEHDMSPEQSHQAGTTQPPDEEQAGLH